MKISQAVSAVAMVSMIAGVCAYQMGKRSGRSQQAYHDAVLAHRSELERCRELGREVTTRLITVGRLRDLSVADFEERFGPLVEIDSKRKRPDSPKGATHLWVHPESHRSFYLFFKDGVLAKHSSSHGDGDIAPHLPLIEERLEKLM